MERDWKKERLLTTRVFLTENEIEVYTCKAMIPLKEVERYEEYPYDKFEEHGPTTIIHFNNGESLVIVMKFDTFAKLHDDFKQAELKQNNYLQGRIN